MPTSFTHSPDGLRIAYDCTGNGPAIVLLHGGGADRLMWHEVNYVERLAAGYTVITLDFRGHGESDLPTDPAAYTPEKLGGDVLAVANACGVDRFTLWGMSFGGKVGRYLAQRSDRVQRIIIMGIPFGSAVTPEMHQDIFAFCEKWPPILEAQRAGTLDPETLSPENREFMAELNVAVIMAWGSAMLDWPSLEPADLPCPALWLVGSEDPAAAASAREYAGSLDDTTVQLQVVDDLDHQGLFLEIDRVFPTMLAFTQSQL